MQKKISRNGFLKLMAGFATLPVIWLFGKAVCQNHQDTQKKKETVTGPFSVGITFFDEFMIIKNGSDIRVLSNHCTHLGCRIGKQNNGKMQCPCHGSEFDRQGNAVKGPAYKPLISLPFKIEGNTLTVSLS